MNIEFEADRGILAVEPSGALSQADFEALGAEIAGLRQEGRQFNGIVIHAREFPGYKRFSDMLAHAEFIREHGDEVRKVALCTDTPLGKLLTLIGQTMVAAEVKTFSFDDIGEAQAWLSGPRGV